MAMGKADSNAILLICFNGASKLTMESEPDGESEQDEPNT